MKLPKILYEDNHLLVVEKPCGWIVQGAQDGDLSLLEWGKDYIGKKYNKPGKVFLAAVSRLDRNVSGVVPFARTSKGAARMNEQISKRTIVKEYVAVVSPAPKQPDARLRHFLTRNEQAAKSIAHKEHIAGSLEALLDYQTLDVQSDRAFVRVHLHTGRKHQIRCQLAAIGSPIVGDVKYGSKVRLSDQIGLHCHSLSFSHPTTREAMTITCRPPSEWNQFGFDMNNLLAVDE